MPRMRYAAALLLLAGCASAPWQKPGAAEPEFRVDSGQCMAQAYSAPAGQPKQLIYNACMQGKGWQQQ